MTFREVQLDEVLTALGDGGEDFLLRACVVALRAKGRRSYTIGGTPAKALRETLELKYRRAASRGKTFTGDGELLLRLQELGERPVAVVWAQHAGQTFFVYVDPSTLKPLGTVVMREGSSGAAEAR